MSVVRVKRRVVSILRLRVESQAGLGCRIVAGFPSADVIGLFLGFG